MRMRPDDWRLFPDKHLEIGGALEHVVPWGTMNRSIQFMCPVSGLRLWNAKWQTDPQRLLVARKNVSPLLRH